MRKFLLASVATLGTGGLTGAALAQSPPGAPVPAPLSAPAPISGPIGAPTQGQQAWPAAPAPTAYVNNNNNYQAPALPGALANPTPGTIVVHFNGKVQVDAMGLWSSVDSRLATAPAGTACASTSWPYLGNNGIGSVKLQPQQIASFARLYAGGDGMATNGLRYGAAIEVRQNFTGQISNNAQLGRIRVLLAGDAVCSARLHLRRRRELGHRARRPGRRPDRHLRQRRDHLPVPADRQPQRRRPAELSEQRGAGVRVHGPGRQRV